MIVPFDGWWDLPPTQIILDNKWDDISKKAPPHAGRCQFTFTLFDYISAIYLPKPTRLFPHFLIPLPILVTPPHSAHSPPPHTLVWLPALLQAVLQVSSDAPW